jgi:hypothetical protein
MDPIKKDNLMLSLKYGVKEDPDFSAKRNNEVIERTIKKMELRKQQKLKEYGEAVRERSEAVASFLHHVKQGRHNNVVNYFGKRELARLRGEEISNVIKSKVKALDKFKNAQA